MDVIDTAQRRQQEEIDYALAARPAPVAGRSTCANLDCNFPVSLVRQKMGAQLCIACQRDAEQEAQRCARGAV